MPNVFWNWAQEWEMIGAIVLMLGFAILGQVDGEMNIGPHGTAISPGETMIKSQRIVQKIPSWGVIAVPYIEPPLEHPIPQAWVDIAAQWITNPQDHDWYVVADPITDRFTPLSHCYRPGEAHNELTLPCVTIEP